MALGSGTVAVVDICNQHAGNVFFQQFIAFHLELGINRKVHIIARDRVAFPLHLLNPPRHVINCQLFAALCAPQVVLVRALQPGNANLVCHCIGSAWIFLLQLLQFFSRHSTGIP